MEYVLCVCTLESYYLGSFRNICYLQFIAMLGLIPSHTIVYVYLTRSDPTCHPHTKRLV